ncbi:MAG: CDP-alcohol phosphatidyltransferase family protein [Saprospiraceae bacterium]
MKLLNHLPNALTLANLFFGTTAIILLINGLIPFALILMGGALVADVLDGAIARKLGLNSDLGVQLDSLADLVTFGVVPAVMIYAAYSLYGHDRPGEIIITLMAALSTVSAGLRLARFNVDERPREYFWGLATPAGGMLVAGWLWAQFVGKDHGLGMEISPWMGVVIPVFLIIFYQVSLRLPSMKSPKPGIITAVLLVAAGTVSFFIIGPISISLTIFGYVFIGLLNTIFRWY